MKRLLLFLCAFGIYLSSMSADKVLIDGLYYNLDSSTKTAEVSYLYYSISNSSYVKGDLKIPNQVNYGGKKYSVTSIGGSAFYSCSGLTSVSIPNSITSIGSSAFQYCNSLTSIIIGNSVSSIGSYAFSGCSSLTSISIPNSVTSIGSFAFQDCSSLISVIIGNSVTSIGSSAFQYCNSLTSVIIGNYVTSIGSYAFSGCSSLTSISIPNSVTSIGSFAFQDCSSLISVEFNAENCQTCGSTNDPAFPSTLTDLKIGNKVKVIPNSAFSGCSSLPSVEIPNSVTSIGNYAFHDCGSLSSVEIPNSITSIGNYAFSGCSRLTSIEIPNSVTSIGNDAFHNCPIETLNINCTIIGSWFSGNSKLKNLTLGDSVTTIGENAFSECSGLTSVIIPNSVTSIGNYAFRGCSNLKSVTCMATIPPSCYSSSFSSRSYEKSVLYVLKNSIDEYKNREPWRNFINIKEVELTDIEFDNLIYYIDESSKTAICGGPVDPQSFSASVIIPESINYEGISYRVTEIIEKAFANCKLMKGVVIPSSIQSIGKDAFSGCTGLVKNAYPDNFSNPFPSGLSISYPGDNSLMEEGVIYNADKTSLYFVSTDKTGVFVVPNTVRNITENAFASCSDITEIKLSDNLTSISGSAFRNCNSLEKINIPSGISSIGSDIFSGCTRLSELIIDDSENLISFASNCFKDSPIKTLYIGRKWNTSNLSSTLFPSLQSLTIGGKITEIPANTFKGWTKLTKVTIGEAVTSIGDYAFDGSGLKELFYNAVNCSSFGIDVFPVSIEKLKIGEKVSLMPDNFLVRGNKLQLIHIPNSVRTIGKYAFIDSYNLKSLYFGTGIQTINKDAFYDTTKLNSEYTIPKIFWLGNTPPEGYKYLKSLINYVANNLYDFNNYKVYQYLSSKFEVDGVIYVPLKPSDRTCDVVDCTYGEENMQTLVPEKVTNLGIELSVRDISDYAFYNNRVIKEVTLANNGVIGKFGFYNCNNFSKIILPSSITSLGNNCFQNCTSLESVVIGEKILILPEYVFSQCVSLAAISVPANVESIKDYAFEGCGSLEHLRFEESFIDNDNDGKFDEEILTLGSNGSNPLFVDCPLNSLFIGRKISYKATAQYGYSPFYRCITLETAEVTDREVKVYDYEFYACESLKSLSIGNGVITIGKWAFSGCRSLEYFSAGYNLKTIGEEAFSDCTGLTEYYSYSENPPACGYQALDDINKWICTLYVPYGQEQVYSSKDQWKDFFFIEEMEPITIEKIELNRSELSLIIGQTFTLTASITPANAPNTNIVWTSNNPVVATVTDQGLVKAVSDGTAVITAHIGDLYAECKVTVGSSNDPDDAVEYIDADGMETVTVFTTTGILLMKDAPRENLETLSPGIYIINGKKILVK